MELVASAGGVFRSNYLPNVLVVLITCKYLVDSEQQVKTQVLGMRFLLGVIQVAPFN